MSTPTPTLGIALTTQTPADARGHWTRLSQALEETSLDWAVLTDPLGTAPQAGTHRIDAVLAACWTATRTHRIGLVPEVTTTHTEPFHVSIGLATLDHVSHGRAGWLATVSAAPEVSALFGRRRHPTERTPGLQASRVDLELWEELQDAVAAVRDLWESWEPGAEIRDTATGRFIDRERVHHVDVEAERFSVRGPSITPRPPQGRLPVLVEAAGPAGLEVARRTADVVLLPAAEVGRTDAARLPDRRRRGATPAVPAEPTRIVADVTLEGDGARVADAVRHALQAGADGARLVPDPAADPFDALALAADVHDRLDDIRPPDTGTAPLRERLGLAPALSPWRHPEDPTARPTDEEATA